MAGERKIPVFKNVETSTYLKSIFSKKATKIDGIFIVYLTGTTYCQINGEDFVNFVALSENMNFTFFSPKNTTIYKF